MKVRTETGGLLWLREVIDSNKPTAIKILLIHGASQIFWRDLAMQEDSLVLTDKIIKILEARNHNLNKVDREAIESLQRKVNAVKVELANPEKEQVKTISSDLPSKSIP